MLRQMMWALLCAAAALPLADTSIEDDITSLIQTLVISPHRNGGNSHLTQLKDRAARRVAPLATPEELVLHNGWAPAPSTAQLAAATEDRHGAWAPSPSAELRSSPQLTQTEEHHRKHHKVHAVEDMQHVTDEDIKLLKKAMAKLPHDDPTPPPKMAKWPGVTSNLTNFGVLKQLNEHGDPINGDVKEIILNVNHNVADIKSFFDEMKTGDMTTYKVVMKNVQDLLREYEYDEWDKSHPNRNRTIPVPITMGPLVLAKTNVSWPSVADPAAVIQAAEELAKQDMPEKQKNFIVTPTVKPSEKAAIVQEPQPTIIKDTVEDEDIPIVIPPPAKSAQEQLESDLGGALVASEDSL